MATNPEESRSPSSQEFSEEEMKEEREHFKSVVNAFLYYRSYSEIKLRQVRERFGQLPAVHRQMLPNFLSQQQEVSKAVDQNFAFVKKMTKSAMGMFENSTVSNIEPGSGGVRVIRASNFHMDKVLTTIKQFFRDWSEEGAKERDMCYKPIIDEIESRFPSDSCTVGDVSVLVPGAGLGRLAFEIAQRGYCCQGNEFSVFMLLGSNFILNQSQGVKTHSIHPWVHQYSNLVSSSHQTDVVRIPDVNPSDAFAKQESSKFSMSAGDFLEVYTTPDEWDCVACCFFIDTAHNVIRYLEKIYHILKPGGYWINFGPLLYHFADMPSEFSVEFPWEEIRRIAVDHIGFEILKELDDQPSCYIQNPHSMMQLSYRSVFMVARKPATTRNEKEGASKEEETVSKPKKQGEQNSTESSKTT